jgi:hypothetical protein
VQPDLARISRSSARLRGPGEPTRRTLRGWFTLLIAVILVGTSLGAGGIATNAFGLGSLFERVQTKVARLVAGPPPDRDTLPTIEETDAPVLPSDEPIPSSEPPPSGQPARSAGPTPTPVPRVAVDIDIVARHGPEFAHELRDDWCSPAGVTTTLAILGLGPPTEARQREIASRIGEWESYRDSHNGEWGPAAMALALDAYGGKGYKIVAYGSRALALRGAAKAIANTNSPAILLAWRGAHTWVMTGFRADADPRVFADAKVSGAYIDDPWYPWTSSIWGKSDPPGTFQNSDEMVRNFLAWKRPEGHYANRDDKFIVLIPTIKRP